jgi:hypothetical protein
MDKSSSNKNFQRVQID